MEACGRAEGDSDMRLESAQEVVFGRVVGW